MCYKCGLPDTFTCSCPPSTEAFCQDCVRDTVCDKEFNAGCVLLDPGGETTLPCLNLGPNSNVKAFMQAVDTLMCYFKSKDFVKSILDKINLYSDLKAELCATTCSCDCSAACIAGSIVSGTPLPMPVASQAYNATITLAGTAPFSISAITKPGWLTITLSGSTITFTGTAPSSGTSAVSFTISNCTGAHSFTYNTTFMIDAANLIFAWDQRAGHSVDMTALINGAHTSVDWGDGIVNNILTHTYVNVGNYTVRIYGSTATTLILGSVDRHSISDLNITSVSAVPSTVTYLQLSGNTITQLPTLTANTGLYFLAANTNNIGTTPDLSANTALVSLDLAVNALPGTLDVSSNTLLQTLYVNVNQLTALNGVSLTNSMNLLEANNNRLPQSNVNSILVDLDANGLSNGVLTLYGMSPIAVPNGSGATAKTSLLGKGWLIITD